MPSHTHWFHELIVVERGCIRVEVAGSQYDAHPGSVLLYQAGTAHEEWAEGGLPLTTRRVAFCWDGFDQNEPVVRPDGRGRVGTMAAWLADERKSSYADSIGYRQSLLQMLLVEFVRLKTHQPHAMVDLIRNYIRTHLEETFALEDLADQAGMSKFHFARLYKSLTGHSPMEDARLIRIDEAQRLILTTSMTLCEIAPRVGICDAHHLSRLMKTHIGCGIRELRQAGR